MRVGRSKEFATFLSRAGDAGGQLRGLAGGFGVKVYACSLDYAVTPFGELGNAHRFSLGARF